MAADGTEQIQPTNQPPRIRRLPAQVVNRIAAGEVVIRPSAALKELLENCLDAGATSITVSVREGGLKLLQVTDNGCGIPLEDLPLLCERFATSKLKSYDDLEQIGTFGFRGEALASISHVARLSVLTKTAASNVAYKAAYLDGAIRAEPEATAGVNGTTIVVEDMFYNVATRRLSVKCESEEYRSIVQVVSRYAIRYSDVSFVCRKQQTGNSTRVVAGADVRTEVRSSVKDNIRRAFGSAVANELMSFEIELEEIEVRMRAHVTSSNYSMKKGVFILFINGRLVECGALRRAVWAAYSTFIAKNGHPFVYLDLAMKQSDIDVNVHPTKKEVRFMHELAITEALIERLTDKLKRAETSRTFLTQSVFVTGGATGGSIGVATGTQRDKGAEKCRTTAATQDFEDQEFSEAGSECDGEMGSKCREIGGKRGRNRYELAAIDSETRAKSKGKVVYAKDKVRAGSHAPIGLLDAFITPKNEAWPKIERRARRGDDSQPMLTSVRTLLDGVEEEAHRGMMQMLREHIFVGVVNRHYALIQYSTQLMLAEIEPLTRELVYQLVLRRLCAHEMFALSPAAPVQRLLAQAGDERTAGKRAALLLSKAEMLEEYFGIALGRDADGGVWLKKLPLIMQGLTPDLNGCARFLLAIAAEVDWCNERQCLERVARALAEWYASDWEPLAGADGADEMAVEQRRHWLLQHVVFDAFRAHLHPSRSLERRHALRQVTSTARLYKIFERC